MIPAKAVDHVGELVGGGQIDGGWVQVAFMWVVTIGLAVGLGCAEPELGEIWHVNDPDNAIGGIGEELTSIRGETEEREEAGG